MKKYLTKIAIPVLIATLGIGGYSLNKHYETKVAELQTQLQQCEENYQQKNTATITRYGGRTFIIDGDAETIVG